MHKHTDRQTNVLHIDINSEYNWNQATQKHVTMLHPQSIPTVLSLYRRHALLTTVLFINYMNSHRMYSMHTTCTLTNCTLY